MTEAVLLPTLILVAALLYSSVGHGGASGYLAAMALAGVAPAVMKPSALVLNILVATIGTIQFARAGCFSWRIFLPLVIGSVPFAFLGGIWSLPDSLYKQIIGVILIFAAIPLIWHRKGSADDRANRTFSWGWAVVAVLCGAGIGFLSGLTGTGGGIFLTPILLFTGWASMKQAAGVSVAFILANSIAGIAGHLTTVESLPGVIPIWAVAAVLGGLIGSTLGSRKVGNLFLRRLLAVVLVIAALKLLFA